MDAPATIEAADEALRLDDLSEARRLLLGALRGIDALTPEEVQVVVQRWADLAVALWPHDEEVGADATAAAIDPDGTGLGRLGRSLVAVGAPDAATAVLRRRLRREPGDLEATLELVAALELQGAFDDAVEVLDEAPDSVASTWSARYLLATNLVFGGRAGRAEELVAALGDGADERAASMVDQLRRRLARLDAAGDVRTDVVAWHRATAGTSLTGAPAVRQHAVEDEASVAADLAAIATAVRTAGVPLHSVSSFGGGRAAAWAAIVAELLDLPVGPPETPSGIVLVDDLGLLPADTAPLFRHRGPADLLCALAAPGSELPVAPDVLGYRWLDRRSPLEGGTTGAVEEDDEDLGLALFGEDDPAPTDRLDAVRQAAVETYGAFPTPDAGVPPARSSSSRERLWAVPAWFR